MTVRRYAWRQKGTFKSGRDTDTIGKGDLLLLLVLYDRKPSGLSTSVILISLEVQHLPPIAPTTAVVKPKPSGQRVPPSNELRELKIQSSAVFEPRSPLLSLLSHSSRTPCPASDNIIVRNIHSLFSPLHTRPCSFIALLQPKNKTAGDSCPCRLRPFVPPSFHPTIPRADSLPRKSLRQK